MLQAGKRLMLWLCLGGAMFAAGPPGVWLDVPFVKQERNGCGAASMAMVMRYWQRQQGSASGSEADAEYILQQLYSPDGIRAADMQRYLQQHGFRTFAFAGNLRDLEQHLQKGRPLIVALKPGALAPLHYVVVVGVDPQQGVVLLNDPAERKLLKREQSTFEKEWDGADHWTLLAVPQAEAASSPR